MLQQRLTRNLYTGQTEPLTAPLSFDFTEDLGNKRNLSLFSQYGGATAAYSLRSLGSYNENVVRVRRASDNDEKDFTASQVSSGELTSWVNSQIVPPLDIGVETSEGRIPVPEGGTSIGTPAAAYSLRNLSTTYTGNVVEVRRSSDSTTQSFTASQITNGDLLDWVLAPVSSFIGNKMLFDGVNDWVSFSDATNIRPESSNFSVSINITLPTNDAQPILSKGNAASANMGYSIIIAAGNLISVRCNADGTVAQRASQSYDASALPAGNYTIKLEIDRDNAVIKGYLDGSNVGWVNGGGGPSSNDITGFGSINNTDDLYVGKTSLAFFTGILNELSVSKNSTDILYALGNGNTDAAWIDTVGSNNGTVNGSPELFTGQGYDGFVSKWYDQSGNDNHATQGTDARQPKIVNAGALVTGGLDFDGVDDYFDAIGASSAGGSADTSIIVAKADSLLQMQLLDQVGVVAGIDAHSIYLDGASGQFSLYAGVATDISYGTATTDTTLHFVLKSNVSSSSIGYINGVGNSLNSGTAGFTGGLRIAKTRATVSSYWNGTISEIIVYHSDQSANRTAIEANIGETYGITGIPAYDNTVDGFVETWYDQSGNGNDATQSTIASQPKIVDGGSLVSGGLDFDGVDDYLGLINLDDSSQPNTIISVSRTDVTGSTRAIYGLGSTTSSPSGYYRSTNKHAIYADIILEGAAYTSGTEYLRFDLFNGASSVVGINGASKVGNSGVKQLTHLTIGDSLLSSMNPLNGRIREIIIYPSNQSANRIAIEANINDHYNIY